MALTTYTAGEVLTAASLNNNFTVAAGSGGLVVVKAETAFSAVASTTADGVFTSAFTNYRIVLRFTTSANDLGIQFRAATVDTTANYNYQQLRGQSSTASASRATSQSSAIISDGTSGAFISLCVLELSGPQLAEPTILRSIVGVNKTGYTSPTVDNYAGNQSDSTAFDGIKFLVSSGTTTGSYTIYGYAKTV